MIIIIKNIPATTTTETLIDFGSIALKICPFLPFKSGHLLKANTFTRRFTSAPYFVSYGILIFDSRKAGLRAIRRLNGKKIKKNTVEVREYFIRTALSNPNGSEGRERRGSALNYDGTAGYSNVFDSRNVYAPVRRNDRPEDRHEHFADFIYS